MGKNIGNIYGVKVGDLFFDSWGYEQTNVDFYQVVKLRGKTQVVLKAINSEYVSAGWNQGKEKPVKNSFKTGSYITRQQHDENGIIRKITKYGETICAGSGWDTLYLTDYETEHTSTSYY